MAVIEATLSLAEGIREVLNATTGSKVTVGEARQLTGGASRQTWLVDTYDAQGQHVPVVLRRDPPGHGDADRMRAEAACLRAAGVAGVPVPTVLASGDTAPGIDAPYLLMDKVDGEAMPRKLQRDPEFEQIRTHLAEDMGFALGLIHRSDTAGLGMLDTTDPLDAIEKIYLDMNEPRPAVEVGLRWLRENRPAKRADALVHGDFRVGNLLIDSTGIQGVLDWELAHLGDPIEDLGWLCTRAWRFGAPEPVGGLGTREQLLDGYQRATDVRPSAAELHWWEAFGTLKWLVLSRFQAERHLSGAEHSLELAAIGRRVCESEYDLLLILGLLNDVPASEPRAPRPTVHDRPRLAEILELVAGTLTDEIASALGSHDRERYQLLICANLLRTAAREVAAGDSADEELQLLLGQLGCESETELALLLRSGVLPYTDATVRQDISTAVLARLRVANPRHFIR
ncbi:phosphotransferase [Aldersonia kunmingensis]|uniref:phosphotransferase n=1 Tax=Aldersonia kunmingensis TaxID=408066 RepID=UPI00082F8672|nr:phosphotransferase [Aldersonia kunmingensis]